MLSPQPFQEASATPGGSVSLSKHFSHDPMAGSSNSGTLRPYSLSFYGERSVHPRAELAVRRWRTTLSPFQRSSKSLSSNGASEGGNLYLSPCPAWGTVLGTTQVLIDIKMNFDFRIVL